MNIHECRSSSRKTHGFTSLSLGEFHFSFVRLMNIVAVFMGLCVKQLLFLNRASEIGHGVVGGLNWPQVIVWKWLRHFLEGTKTDTLTHPGATLRTAHTARTARTAQSSKTLLSRITNLKDSDNFQYHPAAMGALEPRVAQRSGLSSGEVEEAESIPKDTILPALMISLCCFNNTVFWLSSLLSFPHFASLLVTKTPN